ncbi:hypothetical protein OF83DRAFT_1172833 [Amylostereum chailletii]|nr:hypothetical protein OF83DRAFT_1172833 [Amylostereum chailletii]
MARNDSARALPSPSESPAPSSSALPSPSSTKSRPRPDDNDDDHPRKRSRTDLTADERKEARAHRNRIAAQNSRDRRKAQFSALEQRIAELETENYALRTTVGVSALRDTEQHRAVESARERENQELRERVRTLEAGWDAIVKALQLHGIPPGIPSLSAPQPQAPTPKPTPKESAQPSRARSSTPSSSTTTTFPVLVPPSPIFPLSPAPSQSSMNSSGFFDEPESTRHLARVATTAALAVPQQRVDSAHSALTQNAASPPDLDDATMDSLFREILASPSLSAASLPSAAFTGAPVSCGAEEKTDTLGGGDAQGDGSERAEREIQKLLEWLPSVVADGADTDGGLFSAESMNTDSEALSALDLGLGVWDMAPPLSLGPEVF